MILAAVDAGGTRTRAAILLDSGECVGTGLTGRGNPVSAGADAAAANIGGAISRAAAAADIPFGAVDSVTLAAAGGSIFEAGFLTQRLAELGVSAPLAVKGDLSALFCSGTHETSGYSLVAGTGATAARVVDSVEVAVVDGLGWLLGDTGSGFWIGHRVARAVARSLEGRGETSMLGPTLGLLGIEHDLPSRGGRERAKRDLVHAVYGQSPLALAALAPVAFVDERDEVAAGIVAEAASGLAQAVVAVHDGGVGGPLVVGGGVMAGQPRLRVGVVSALEAAGLKLRVVEATDGLVGASVLALRDAGVTVDARVFETVTATTAEQLSGLSAR